MKVLKHSKIFNYVPEMKIITKNIEEVNKEIIN